jgi:signal transduction histidine kinase
MTDEVAQESRPRLVSWFLRPQAPPLWVGVVVAACLIALEAVLVVGLERLVPDQAFGALFLLGVMVISASWGFGLSVATTLVSGFVYMSFHLGDDGFDPLARQDWTAIVIFLPIALLANLLVGQARLRAAEAEMRRREAEQSKEELRVLAEQQAALRRVATLVAQAVSPSEVFAAVADELARRLGLQHSALIRFESDGSSQLIACHDDPPTTRRLGERYPRGHGGVAEEVYVTGRAARMDRGAVVGVPIVVHGRIWGAAVVGSAGDAPLPADTEAGVEDFADLVATAISNAQARSDLAASRARIVTAADSARRRLERDLHDGAQQRLLSLGLELRAAEASLRPGCDDVADQLAEIVSGLTTVSDELREISRGIHPAILSKGGLGPALKAVARRSAVPVDLDIAVDGRLSESVEVAAYFLVAESLTNVARYAGATGVTVSASTDSSTLRLEIHDDGVGGADPARGSGLIGLIDRVEALGGRFDWSSPPGEGTSIRVTIPFEAPVQR